MGSSRSKAPQSEEDSTSSDSDATQDHPVGPENLYEEIVPEGWTYFKHLKSQRVHCVKDSEDRTLCKMAVNANYRELDRTLHFRYPKCLRCFPDTAGRIRTREDAVGALDQAIERARKSRRS